MRPRLSSPARSNSMRRAADNFSRSAVIFCCIAAFAFRRRAGITRKPSAATTLASRMPVTSAAAVDAASVTSVPKPSAAPPAAAAVVTAERRRRVAAEAACDRRGYRLPLPEVLIDQPIDQLRDAPLDLPRGIRNHPLLEFLLDARAVEQIDDASETQRVFEVLEAARLHV